MFSRGTRSLTAAAKTATATATTGTGSVYKSTGFNPYHRAFATMAERVHRVTMFKMPKAEDREKMLEQYRKMAVDNQRNGKPYILSMTVGPAEEDPRTQGYTLVSKTEFANMDDMRYYDNDCPAHGAVKTTVQGLTVDGILTVYFNAQASGGSEKLV